MEVDPSLEDTMASPISFTKEISLGNILSATVMLISAVVFILSIRSSSQLEMTELRGEMKVYSAKLEQLGRDFQDYKLNAQTSNAELRQTLGSVNAAVADMRVLIAQKAAIK